MSKTIVLSLISAHLGGSPFTAQEIPIAEGEADAWVRVKVNPQRFLPKIFDGNWAYPDQHPKIGIIRVLRVMTGSDEITRVIGRQGDKIYASPWIA